jgi:hypothetical protein
MWNVPPKILCRQHLLGEHNEMHSFLGSIKKGRSVKGYIDKHQLELHNIKKRHDELANEMKYRGYRHNSPMEELNFETLGSVSSTYNMIYLKDACSECRKRILKSREDK